MKITIKNGNEKERKLIERNEMELIHNFRIH